MSDDNFERECQPTSIRVVTLDWEKVTEGDLGDLATGVDVILAADVVYDTSIIDALVRVIRWLLSWPGKSNISHSPVMFIASTVRNTDTRDCFLMALESAAISHMEVSGPEKETFFYDRCIPIDILQLKMT
ncbi:hypothetical protein LSAT2_030063 [Lamellibrachia satsuma]|nr:hypothetical protein LSAT2_030063 [Lamellibrachia satsuma]